MAIFVPVYSSLPQSKVPDWLRNTVKWWGDGKVSDTEFLNAMKFLIQQKVIKIDDTKDVKDSRQTNVGDSAFAILPLPFDIEIEKNRKWIILEMIYLKGDFLNGGPGMIDRAIAKYGHRDSYGDLRTYGYRTITIERFDSSDNAHKYFTSKTKDWESVEGMFDEKIGADKCLGQSAGIVGYDLLGDLICYKNNVVFEVNAEGGASWCPDCIARGYWIVASDIELIKKILEKIH